jgi:hypothetical protein
MQSELCIDIANSKVLEVGCYPNRSVLDVQLRTNLIKQVLDFLKRFIVLGEQIEVFRIAMVEMKGAERGAPGQIEILSVKKELVQEATL